MKFNMSFNKSNIAFYWVLIVVFVSVGIFIHLIKEDRPATLPTLELNFYDESDSVAEAIGNKLEVDFKSNKFYWIGLEPDKIEYLDLLDVLLKKLKTYHSFHKIIVDGELNLKSDQLNDFGFTDVVFVKENLYELGEKLQQLESSDQSYILISASIYTNSLLKKNPIHILKEKYKLKPVTLSFAYFPLTAQDERNMTFACRTEDQTGTTDWGCVVVNRARFARRKISETNLKSWVGLVDSTTENDYILLFKKIQKLEN